MRKSLKEQRPTCKDGSFVRINVDNIMTEYPRQVTINEDDLKLVENLNIKDDPELFTIRVDSKRPFGNSDIFKDMCRKLDLDLVETVSGEEVVPMKHKEKLENHAQKLPTVVEVILENGRVTGTFAKESYSEPWYKKD